MKTMSENQTVIILDRERFQSEKQYMGYLGLLTSKNTGGEKITTEIFIANCNNVEEIPALVEKGIDKIVESLKGDMSKEQALMLGERLKSFKKIRNNIESEWVKKEASDVIKEKLVLWEFMKRKDTPHVFVSRSSNTIE